MSAVNLGENLTWTFVSNRLEEINQARDLTDPKEKNRRRFSALTSLWEAHGRKKEDSFGMLRILLPDVSFCNCECITFIDGFVLTAR